MDSVDSDLTEAFPHPTISRSPTCELYQGTLCEKFLKNEYVFIRPNASQFLIEAKLTEASKVISSSTDLTESCAAYALPTLCHSALPICQKTGPPAPELICRKDCEMLENDICKLEYAIAKRHPLLGQVLSFEDCSILPAINCRKLGLPIPKPSDKSQKCYQGSGRDYLGEVSTTASNKSCIPWNYQSRLKTVDYPELLGGHNFCRNPASSERAKPWCFSSENTPELCNVPKCEDTTSQSVIIAFGGAVVLLFFLFFFLCYLCCSRNSKRKVAESAISSSYKISPGKSSIIKIKSGSEGGSNSGSRREMTALIFNSNNSSQNSEPKIIEFNFNSIIFEEELGEGAFGKVYRGEVISVGGEKMLVAIKTLKEDANSKTVAEFKREVDLMSELRHPNIISLLGVCTSNRLCMLFEFMSHGDLHEYLIAHSPNQDVPRNCVEPILEQEDLLNISIQIAAGMDYLCSQHFVHRDLATRNCLVGDNLIVKISDFGLSRDVYSSDYYRVQKSALLPIRWMSPESILYGKFTVESDIWSFGIVLWEIYSYGLQPYFAHNNTDVVDMIRSHQVLTCPEGCPPRMYALMIECWNQVPSRRPQFAEIHSRLLQWRDTCSNNGKMDRTRFHHKTHHFHNIL